jgi:hypothetical protein
MHFQGSKSKRVVPTQVVESGKESGSEELEGGEYALSDDGSGLGLGGSGSLLTRNAKSFLSRMSKAFVRSGGGAKAAGADGDCVTEDHAWDAAQTVRLFCWRELFRSTYTLLLETKKKNSKPQVIIFSSCTKLWSEQWKNTRTSRPKFKTCCHSIHPKPKITTASVLSVTSFSQVQRGAHRRAGASSRVRPHSSTKAIFP